MLEILFSYMGYIRFLSEKEPYRLVPSPYIFLTEHHYMKFRLIFETIEFYLLMAVSA